MGMRQVTKASFTAPLGPLITSISCEELESMQRAFSKPCIKETAVLASYNWLEGSSASIIIPGTSNVVDEVASSEYSTNRGDRNAT